MFDIGFSELVLLLFVGLVVLGPKRLPVAIRTVMGWVSTIRGLAANVQNELKQELKLQELQDSIKKAEQLNLSQLSPELNETLNDLKLQADKMRAELEAKAAAANTTVKEQIQEIKQVSQSIEHQTAESQSKTEQADKTEISEIVTDSEQSTEQSAEIGEEIFQKSTALSPEEQAELAELLSEYYPPDDVELAPSTKKS